MLSFGFLNSKQSVPQPIAPETPDAPTNTARVPTPHVENDAESAKAAPSTNMLAVINTLADRADPIIALLSATVDRYQKGKADEARFSIHMAWVAVLVVAFIVGVAGFLTYVEKVDGATFTFLLGLIVGYVLTFIRDAIRTPEA